MEELRTIIVTGAGGFVGKRFIAYNQSRYNIIPLSLRNGIPQDIGWSNVHAIVHLAGKAHEMKPVPDEIYYDVNYDLTKQLAMLAKAQNVAHFIYISSTKVYGDVVSTVLDEAADCHPSDPYGKSKLLAEQFLLEHSSDTFKVAIVRPPLVYGPYVKGNMLKLLHLADTGMPLPFGRADNQRSVVFIDNLITLINTIIDQQGQGIFVAGDAAPVSTGFLVKLMRKHMHRKPGLIEVPLPLRTLLKKIKPALYERLYGSFVVNNQVTNKRLNFHPLYTTEQGLEEMVKWYKSLNAS